MNDIAIKVEGLGKQYHIGRQQARYKTIRETIIDGAKAPFRRAGRVVRGRGSAADLDETIWALKDVSFEVKQGEVVGVIGRNGAGKTTLLKLLSRITEPTTGDAWIHGRVGSLLEVGTGFHPELTGRENIYLNGAIIGMKRSEINRKFDDIVEFAEISRFIDTPVKHYSSGMFVRLAFSVAAHLEPEILLVDEVLAVGDVAFQKKCLGKMGDVAVGGNTVLFVSHNLSSIRKLCNHAMLLDSGLIVTKGSVDEVTDIYTTNILETADSDSLPMATDPNAIGTALHLKFIDNAGYEKTVFKIGEPILIRLIFDIFRHVDHMIAAVGIKSVNVNHIITYWSEPQKLNAGRYYVDYECDIPFSSSSLEFIVGLSSYERTFYHEQWGGTLKILDVAVDGHPVRTRGSVIQSLKRSKIMSLS